MSDQRAPFDCLRGVTNFRDAFVHQTAPTSFRNNYNPCSCIVLSPRTCEIVSYKACQRARRLSATLTTLTSVTELFAGCLRARNGNTRFYREIHECSVWFRNCEPAKTLGHCLLRRLRANCQKFHLAWLRRWTPSSAINSRRNVE